MIALVLQLFPIPPENDLVFFNFSRGKVIIVWVVSFDLFFIGWGWGWGWGW